VLLVGAALVVLGQSLNLMVFARLGRVGVFYGNRLGHHVRWCQGFPFSWIRHPQCVGTVLAIWGLFVLLRYPAPDWAALPLLETLYYTIGSCLEQGSGTALVTVAASADATAADPHASTSLH
jgi:protein-S-isoprenylcysteine O-methyltransferase Ste14